MADTSFQRWALRNFYTKTELTSGALGGLYFTESEFISTSAGVADAGKPIKTNSSGLVDNTFLTTVPLLAGRSGGTTLFGGTAANDDLILHGTSNATRTTSYVLLQPTAGNVGIGNSAPAAQLHMVSTVGTGRSGFIIQSPTPNLSFFEDDATVDNKWWDLIVSAEGLALRVVNDANSVATSIFDVQRTGTTIDSVTIGGTTVNVTNTLQQGGVAVVTTTGTQTLTNKTLTSPTINSATMGTAMSVTGTSTFTGSVSESALSSDNIRIGVISGLPRIMFEDNGSTQYGIDNSAGTLRFLTPGVVRATLDSSGNFTASGTITSATLYGGANANDDITIHGTSNATRTTSYVAMQPSGGRVVVGGSTSDHVFEVQAQGASNYRMTMNLNVSGINYLNSYNSAVGVLTAAPLTIVSSDLACIGDTFTIQTAKTPASASATGTTGMIAWDTSYLYICTGSNQWRRVAHATW